MMKRAVSTLAVSLLLTAAIFLPIIFLRPSSDNLDAGSATPPPDATIAAEATPSPEPADGDPKCGSATVSYDAIEPTIANRAEGASAVVIAVVQSIGEAQWNTDDGTAPTFQGSPPMDSYIFRPVVLSVDTLARGDLLGSALAARLLGGTVGCYAYDFEDSPELKTGQRYAFFLGRPEGDSGAAEPGINEAWSIRGGMVETPLEGEVTLASFLAAVENAPVGPLGE